MAGDRVECRSNHQYLGRPLAFYWQGMRLEVIQVVAERRTPQRYEFRIQAANNEFFELTYDDNTDQWSVSHL
jgi:hypothetical protein